MSNVNTMKIKFDKEIIRKMFSGNYRPYWFLLVVVGISTAIEPAFISMQNIRALAVASSLIMILAVAEALVVLTGMIDLGLEAVLASAGVIAAVLNIVYGMPAWISVSVPLVYGIIIGLINGLLVTKAGIPSFVTTLGMYWGLRGVALVISKGVPIQPASVTPSRPITFSGFAGNIFNFPVMMLIAIVVTVIFQIFVSNSKKGIDIYAIGGNETAARNCGIKTDSTKILVFIISGFLSALAGVMMTAWIRQGYAWTAQGYSLNAVAAIVLGGVAFTGGYGTIIGAAIGAVVVVIISNMITLTGISPMYNYIAIATVLIVAGLQVHKSKTFVK